MKANQNPYFQPVPPHVPPLVSSPPTAPEQEEACWRPDLWEIEEEFIELAPLISELAKVVSKIEKRQKRDYDKLLGLVSEF